MRFLICAALMCALTACSESSIQEDKEDLSRTRGEWTHEQTDKAIDIYLEELKREDALLDRQMELCEQLKFFDENRCSRDVLRQRRAEIDSVRNALAAKRLKISKVSK